MDDAEKIAGLTGAVFVGIDRARENVTYCEMKRDRDGSITVLDLYCLPKGHHP